MKISLKWLSQYIEIGEFLNKPEELASLLTNKGLEVESIENRAKQFDHVIIGHILEKAQHPDADRLTVCQVSAGGGVVHQIVCGAKNHNQGDRVVASLPGAVLPGNFEIKKSKIRGVESAGMLCSEVELGLAKESAGIMILPQDAPIGKSFAEYMGYDDIVFDIKVTANRADCLSHYGLAREIGCLLGRDFAIKFGTLSIAGPSGQDIVTLEVLDSDSCPRYAARVIKGVKVGPSPQWLKSRLESVGLNSINNVVDVTNFVMMELGQPLHAFDIRFLKGSKIRVSRSERGEKFISLDGTEFELDGSELMIRDSEKNVAMAGVVGSLNSGVKDDTQDLFIECAYFLPSSVRKTSRRHGIQTDAAYRFTRGVDPEGTMLALNRCCELIHQTAGGTVYSNHYDIYPHPIKKQSIPIHLSQIAQRLGFQADANEFTDWMKRVGCKVTPGDSEAWEITPPTYRPDIEIAEDLMEEYARLKGYEAIPEFVPSAQVAPTPHAAQYTLSRLLSRKLQAEGFQQSINLGFINEKFESAFLGDRQKLKPFGIEIAEKSIKVKNPLSEDMNVMRSSLLPGLIQNTSHNERYGAETGRLFETGFTFDVAETGFVEDWRLGLVAWGSTIDLWNKSQEPLVLEVKSSFENVLKGLNAKSWTWNTHHEPPEFLHPGQNAYLFFEGKVVGFIGSLHPKWIEELKLKGPVVVGEFDLSLIMQGQPRISKMKSLSKFPSVARDLAFVMPKNLQVQDVVTAVKKAGGVQLNSVRVFDVFEGASLGIDMKSAAFRLVYQDPNATLTEDQINTLQKKVVEDVAKKLNIQVR